MQLHGDQCSLLDRRKRIQSDQRNDLNSFLQQSASLSGGEIRAVVGGKNQSRPIPPLLGNGDAVDLFKLFVHVKKRGGYDAITRDGLWEDVGEDQGLRCSGLGSAIKLIYYKYFPTSEKSFTVNSEGEAVSANHVSDEADLISFALKISKARKKNEEESEDGSTDGGKVCDGNKDWASNEVESLSVSSDNRKDAVDRDVSIPVRAKTGEKEEMMVQDLSAKEESSSLKRKRECTLSQMLNWLDSVAKNPANPGIGTLPECTNWNNYSLELCWKQVLLTRATLLHKRPQDLSPEQFPCQKMHPSMFDDARESKVRSSPRLHILGSLGTSANHISSLSSFNLRKRIPVGPCFQAQVPEWSGVPAESDSRWLGTRFWPPKDKCHVYELEADGDPAKKTSRNPGSFMCIRTQVFRRRMMLKVELGSVFNSWKFNMMGEEVANSWSKKDEKKFGSVVRENPLSQGKRFWDKMVKTLPTKTRQEFVSYYFNVFLLRRRAYQNRNSLSNIDSDDDETEFIAKSCSSILSPGKKNADKR